MATTVLIVGIVLMGCLVLRPVSRSCCTACPSECQEIIIESRTLGSLAGSRSDTLNFDVALRVCAILSLRRSLGPIRSANEGVRSCGSTGASCTGSPP